LSAISFIISSSIDLLPPMNTFFYSG